jgi:hypothetical protein
VRIATRIRILTIFVIAIPPSLGFLKVLVVYSLMHWWRNLYGFLTSRSWSIDAVLKVHATGAMDRGYVGFREDDF